MNRFHKSMIVIAIFLVPSLVFAGANKFGVSKLTVVTTNNTVTIPLVITNEDNLTALDIPLSFSEGVTLKEVDFNNTRISYFDLKIANINNDDNTVVIGLLPQMSSVSKPDLKAGTGVIANLVFEINDPNLTEITIKAVSLSDPNHDLTFVYHDVSAVGDFSSRTVTNDSEDGGLGFESITVSLLGKGSLPDAFALMQNYPNPFNPSTMIRFDLPKPTHVTIRVYNVLGQEVAVLVDAMKEAGEHSVEFDANSFATGLYFYRIDSDSFSETKKMMLLK